MTLHTPQCPGRPSARRMAWPRASAVPRPRASALESECPLQTPCRGGWHGGGFHSEHLPYDRGHEALASLDEPSWTHAGGTVNPNNGAAGHRAGGGAAQDWPAALECRLPLPTRDISFPVTAACAFERLGPLFLSSWSCEQGLRNLLELEGWASRSPHRQQSWWPESRGAGRGSMGMPHRSPGPGTGIPEGRGSRFSLSVKREHRARLHLCSKAAWGSDVKWQ